MKNIEFNFQPEEFDPGFDSGAASYGDQEDADEDELLSAATEDELRRLGRGVPRQRLGLRPRGAVGFPRRRFVARPGRRPGRRPRHRIDLGAVHSHDCPNPDTEYIRWVQSSLNQVMGANLPISGLMNPESREALRRFQQQRGLPPDGIAGPDSQRALLDAKGGGPRDDAAGTPKSTDTTEPATDSELFDYGRELSETQGDEALRELSASNEAAVSCQRPLGGAPSKGLFSGPTRDGTRWYTPTSGDNLWSLSRTVLQRIFARHSLSRAPTGREIAKMSEDIKSDPCNAHMVGRMFLPRFQSDRFAVGGSHYGAIHIRAQF